MTCSCLRGLYGAFFSKCSRYEIIANKFNSFCRVRLVPIIPLTISRLANYVVDKTYRPPQEPRSAFIISDTCLVFQPETTLRKFHTLFQQSVSIISEPVSIIKMFLREVCLNFSNDSRLWASGLILVTCCQKPPTPIITERSIRPLTHFALSSSPYR